MDTGMLRRDTWDNGVHGHPHVCVATHPVSTPVTMVTKGQVGQGRQPTPSAAETNPWGGRPARSGHYSHVKIMTDSLTLTG